MSALKEVLFEEFSPLRKTYKLLKLFVPLCVYAMLAYAQLFYSGLDSYFFKKEWSVSEHSNGLTLTKLELQEKLRAVARENTLSCEQIQKFAAENGLALESMRPLVESAGITVLGCSGACT